MSDYTILNKMLDELLAIEKRIIERNDYLSKVRQISADNELDVDLYVEIKNAVNKMINFTDPDIIKYHLYEYESRYLHARTYSSQSHSESKSLHLYNDGVNELKKQLSLHLLKDKLEISLEKKVKI